MGFFNRNKQQQDAAAATPAPATTTTVPTPQTAPTSTPVQQPGSPPRGGAASESVYSENTKSQKTDKSSEYHPDDDPIDEEVDEAEIEEDMHRATEWDEGGKSHCGYSDSVHDTLMAVGGSVHGVVGDPGPSVERKMNTVANWFQEMSYAVRDFWRGEGKMSEDLQDVMNSVMPESEDEAHHTDDEKENAVVNSNSTPELS